MSVEEIKRSFNSILYERTTSPFYGTFIVSWVIWNWRIPYLTFFVNSQEIKPLTKIQYIELNYLNIWDGLVFPFLSCLVLIGIVPLLSNLLYKLSLFYEEKRVLAKQDKEKDRLITKEQYGRLINEMNDLDRKYESNISSKMKEIVELNSKIGSIEGELFAHNQLRIVFAKYGILGGKMVEVTSSLSMTFGINTELQVTNLNLGINEKDKDPAPDKLKHVQIIYEYRRQVKELIVKENDYLFFKGDEITHGATSFLKPRVRVV